MSNSNYHQPKVAGENTNNGEKGGSPLAFGLHRSCCRRRLTLKETSL